MMQINVTPEELLTVVREMFPVEYERAAAELTIRKQTAEIQRLNAELDSRNSAAASEGERAA